MKRTILCFITILGLHASVVSIAAAEPPQPSKPNILFLFADDLCCEAIHSMGNDEVQTPNLDRLASHEFALSLGDGNWAKRVEKAEKK